MSNLGNTSEQLQEAQREAVLMGIAERSRMAVSAHEQLELLLEFDALAKTQNIDPTLYLLQKLGGKQARLEQLRSLVRQADQQLRPLVEFVYEHPYMFLCNRNWRHEMNTPVEKLLAFLGLCAKVNLRAEYNVLIYERPSVSTEETSLAPMAGPRTFIEFNGERIDVTQNMHPPRIRLFADAADLP